MRLGLNARIGSEISVDASVVFRPCGCIIEAFWQVRVGLNDVTKRARLCDRITRPVLQRTSRGFRVCKYKNE